MKIRRTQNLCAILSVAIILMMGAGHLSAQLLPPAIATPVPSLLEYGGFLTGNFTGNRTIGVRLYNASTNGTLLYSENIGTVKVTNGEFYFQYGTNGTAGNSTTPTTIEASLNGTQQWLGLTVNGTEQPRERLVAVPFALRSADAQKTKPKFIQVKDAVGKLAVAFGGNESNLVSNRSDTIATMEKTAKDLLEVQKAFRVIGVTGNLSFGNSTAPRELVISNTGFYPLEVSGITYPSGFSGNWSGTILPNASRNVTVTFTPIVSQTTYSGNITVKSNASAGRETLVVSGVAIVSMVSVPRGNLPSTSLLGNQTVESFQIGRCEVTWGEWKEVRDWAVSNNKGYDLAGLGGTWPSGRADNFPVVNVSWYDVVKWCNAKSEKENKTPVYQKGDGTTYKAGQLVPTQSSTANGYRLPSEKEWEWAARGGGSSGNYTYSGSNTASDVAWTYDNSPDGTKAVGMKQANQLGTVDMSGNVLEWCWDVVNTSNRRLRGGSWNFYADFARVANRGGSDVPDSRNYGFGFRMARNLGN